MSNLIRYHDQPLCNYQFCRSSLTQDQISKDGYRVSISGTAAMRYLQDTMIIHIIFIQ